MIVVLEEMHRNLPLGTNARPGAIATLVEQDHRVSPQVAPRTENSSVSTLALDEALSTLKLERERSCILETSLKRCKVLNT